MQKSLALVTLFAVSTLASRVTDHVNTQMLFAIANNEKIREKYNIPTPASRFEQVSHAHVYQGSMPPSFHNWAAGVSCPDKYDILRGFAYGLQYSPATQGACYISMDEAINDIQDITTLLKEFYNPTVWADLANVANNYMVIGSALMNNCNVYQFLNQFTGGFSSVSTTMISRLMGGAINEIPSELNAIEKSKTCYQAATHAAKIFSLVFNYYI